MAKGEKFIKITDHGTLSRVIGMVYPKMVKEIRKAEPRMTNDEVIHPIMPPDAPEIRRMGRSRSAQIEFRATITDDDGKKRLYCFEYLLDVVVSEIVPDDEKPAETHETPETAG